jgi:hypothetical protein
VYSKYRSMKWFNANPQPKALSTNLNNSSTYMNPGIFLQIRYNNF